MITEVVAETCSVYLILQLSMFTDWLFYYEEELSLILQNPKQEGNAVPDTLDIHYSSVVYPVRDYVFAKPP